jgi:hypothetical protein
MQLPIQAKQKSRVSQCGFAHVGHLPRSPSSVSITWPLFSNLGQLERIGGGRWTCFGGLR